MPSQLTQRAEGVATEIGAIGRAIESLASVAGQHDDVGVLLDVAAKSAVTAAAIVARTAALTEGSGRAASVAATGDLEAGALVHRLNNALAGLAMTLELLRDELPAGALGIAAAARAEQLVRSVGPSIAALAADLRALNAQS